MHAAVPGTEAGIPATSIRSGYPSPMFRKVLGKVAKKVLGVEDRPVTASTPDDWNRVDQPAVAESAAPTASVTFENLGITHPTKPGTSVLDAAIEAGIDLNHYCGGMCSCGSCRVVIVSGEVSPMDDMEDATLSVVRIGKQDRLGCQARVQGAVVVTVPSQDF